MDNDIIFFAKKLKTIRKNKHLTLEQLAEGAGISPNHISKLESARTTPSFNLLSRLASAMNIEIKDLFDFDNLKNSETVREEFLNMAKFSDIKYLQKLYNIHKYIIE